MPPPTPQPPYKPTDRPSPLLWFLAGGSGAPPTVEKLREWKRRDREWKERRGWDVEGGGNFWKEVWRGVGWRFGRMGRKGKKSKSGGGGEVAGDGAEGGAVGGEEGGAAAEGGT
ncbi:MAG: hypothetical protein LQ338_005751 [Usnochroma carphineum]|nr:MAG: hypothetical protein LQ338_005751 [Usnochroma carphineum]